MRPAVFLHLLLEQVALTLHEFVAGALLELLEFRVVVVVIVLDDLECPPALDDVPAQNVTVNLVCELVMPRLP